MLDIISAGVNHITIINKIARINYLLDILEHNCLTLSQLHVINSHLKNAIVDVENLGLECFEEIHGVMQRKAVIDTLRNERELFITHQESDCQKNYKVSFGSEIDINDQSRNQRIVEGIELNKFVENCKFDQLQQDSFENAFGK